jgi:hypothetical protein
MVVWSAVDVRAGSRQPARHRIAPTASSWKAPEKGRLGGLDSMRTRRPWFAFVPGTPLLGWAAGLLIVLAAPAALAEADSEYVREGAYVSIAGVYALQNASGDYKNLDDTGGVHGRFGIRIAPALAIEFYGEWLYYDDENVGSGGVLAKFFVVEMFDTSLLDGIIQPYLIGGAGAIFADRRGSGSDKTKAGGNFRGGGGVDVYLTENAMLYGEAHYSGAGGDPSGIESTNFLAGFGWRF